MRALKSAASGLKMTNIVCISDYFSDDFSYVDEYYCVYKTSQLFVNVIITRRKKFSLLG